MTSMRKQQQRQKKNMIRARLAADAQCGTTVQEQPSSTPSAEATGLGNGVAGQAGFIGATKLPRMLARAVGWQSDNRFKLDRTEVELRESAVARGATIYDEIALNAIDLMKDGDLRNKAVGVRAGIAMARIVQSDDHKKMTEDTAITPVILNQHINVDHRKTYVMQLPANNRESKHE